MEKKLSKLLWLGLLLATLILSVPLYGQNRHIDVLHLKNGNTVRGNIIEIVTDQFVKIRALDKNVWTFPMSDVASIKFASRSLKPMRPQDDMEGEKPYGYFNLTQLGILIGDSDNDTPISLSMINGYRFGNGVSLGVGVGVESFKEAQLPVFADLRFHFRKKDIIPFLFVQGGYSFALENREEPGYGHNLDYDSHGGILINPGMGVGFHLKGNTFLDVSLSYRYQEAEHEGYNHTTDDSEKLMETYNRVFFQIGLRF